jgi:hypothetical protein
MTRRIHSRREIGRVGLAAAATVLVFATVAAGCAEWNMKKKEEEEAARNTFACSLDGERLVVKFDAGEARVLLPGVRYSNGYFEMRGKGMELVFYRDGAPTRLEDCKPYLPEKPPA